MYTHESPPMTKTTPTTYPQRDISDLKSRVDLATVVGSYGIQLTKRGKSLQACCPFHSEDTPSFTVTPEKQLWHCFGCDQGGDVIKFVELIDKLEFPEAVEKLKRFVGEQPAKSVESEVVRSAQLVEVSPARRVKLLTRVAEFYHRIFLNRPEALRYLTKVRGIADVGLLKNFQVGYADGSLLKALPQDDDTIQELKAIGVLTESGRELFKDCAVFPLWSRDGAIVNLYGRRIQDGQVNHLYLPGPKQGLWNAQAARRSKTIVLCESVLDALTALDRGIGNAIPAYGVHGLTVDLLALFAESKVGSVLICFDGDEAGRVGSAKAESQLIEKSFHVGVVNMPDGEDINSFLSQHSAEELQALIDAAMPVVPVAQPDPIPGSKTVPLPTQGFEPTKSGFRVAFAGRCYEVKGIAKETTQLKATIKAWGEKAKGFELNTLDMYSSRSRDAFAKSCAAMFGVDDAVAKSDLQQLLTHMETMSEQTNEQAPTEITLSAEDEARAMAFLTNPNIFDEILSDFETLGIAGETTNKKVCYLTSISRKLDDPLSVLIQSRSASGKSTIMDAVVRLTPETEALYRTRLTPTSLFYGEADALVHKLIAVEEAAGLGEAAYSLRALQSSKRLTVAVTVKDPQSGRPQTVEYEVNGPVAVLMTTTSQNVDEETASRFLVVTVDESKEMTERILNAQRHRDTLAGYLAELEKNAVISKHHAAQQLLEPLVVLNPYAEQLTFPALSLRARRDHKKYLMIIKAVALLHQKQRPVCEAQRGGQVFRYIQVTREDIRKANELAVQVFATSMDELSAPARKLFNLIRELAQSESAARGIPPEQFSFGRRTLREATTWSETQVRTHLEELTSLEYVRAKSGSQGKEYLYELIVFDGPTQDQRFTIDLTDPDTLLEPVE